MTSYGQSQPPPYGLPPQPPVAPGQPMAPQYAQQPQQPQYAQQPQQHQQPVAPQYAQQPQQQPMAHGQMPAFYMADEHSTAVALEQSTAVNFGEGGPFAKYLKFLGPVGETDWKNVQTGYEAVLMGRICPPSAEGKPVFVESETFFFKSASFPKGRTIAYEGEDSLLKEAFRLGAQSPDPVQQNSATAWGRVRKQYLYNWIDLSNPTSHAYEDGIMRPFILGAGRQLQGDIKRICEARSGINALIHPQTGRALRIAKKKTGPSQMNVEYGIMDMDPGPLDGYFWPILQNLWDLEDQLKKPTQEEVVKAIQEMGLPMPATGQSFGQVPQSYEAGPNPPAVNPYPQQPVAPQGQGQYMGPQTPVPPTPQQPGMYQQPQQAYQQPMAPQPGMYQQPQQAAPPMYPPQVSSRPVETAYTPQAGGAIPPALPGVAPQQPLPPQGSGPF